MKLPEATCGAEALFAVAIRKAQADRGAESTARTNHGMNALDLATCMRWKGVTR